MSGALTYAYITTRTRGRRSFLLVKSDYDSMLAAENVQAILRKLEKTPYQPFTAPLLTEDVDVGKIERNLMAVYNNEAQRIRSNLKSNVDIDFFNEFNNSLELKCLAAILKSILGDVTWEEANQYLLPYGKLDSAECKTIIDSKDVGKALKFIRNEDIREKIEAIRREAEEPTRQALEVESAINKHSALEINKKISRLKEDSRKKCARLMGITFDTTNIMTVLRLKKITLTQDEIKEHLIPFNYKSQEEELRRAASAGTEKDAIRMFTAGYYADVITPLIGSYDAKEDLSLFEIAFKRFHAEECGKSFLSIFHLGEALAYIYLKLYEIRDLITILTGKFYGLAAEAIEPSLVLHQPPHPI